MEKDCDTMHEGGDIFCNEDVLLCVREKELLEEYTVCRKNNDTYLMYEIFSSLCAFRREWAVKSGYDDYYSYMLYHAGITPEDMKRICGYVLKNFPPESSFPEDEVIFSSCGESLKYWESVAADIPAAGEFYAQLKSAGRVNLSQRSFTAYDGENYPQIYLFLTGRISDGEVFFHELGHAMGLYRTGGCDRLTSEIHAVMTEYLPYGYGTYREKYIRTHSMMTEDSVRRMCGKHEFSRIIYSENIPLREAPDVYTEVMKRYTGREYAPGKWLYDEMNVFFPGYGVCHILSALWCIKNSGEAEKNYENIITGRFSGMTILTDIHG